MSDDYISFLKKQQAALEAKHPGHSPQSVHGHRGGRGAAPSGGGGGSSHDFTKLEPRQKITFTHNGKPMSGMIGHRFDPGSAIDGATGKPTTNTQYVVHTGRNTVFTVHSDKITGVID